MPIHRNDVPSPSDLERLARKVMEQGKRLAEQARRIEELYRKDARPEESRWPLQRRDRRDSECARK